MYTYGRNVGRQRFPRRFAACVLLLTLLAAAAFRSLPAAAQARLALGGTWTAAAELLTSGGEARSFARGELSLHGRTLTSPWRLYAYGRMRLAGPLHDASSWRAEGMLDRLYVRFSLPRADVRLGKQYVNWGIGYAWDPTDAFNPPDPADPERVRPGIVAAVVDVPTGPLDYWSLAVAEGKYGVRRRGHSAGYDWSWIAVLDRGDVIVGADLKGDMLVGWHLAAAYRRHGSSSATAAAESSWQMLLGADYSWYGGKLVWLGEYFLAGDGGPPQQHTFQQIRYALDEFTSLHASLLAQLPAGPRVWSAGLSTELGGASRLSAHVSYAVPGTATPSVPPSQTVVRLSLSKAF